MSKKLLLTTLVSVAAIGATATAADANYSTPDKYGVVSSVFNPAYRPLQNDWALQAGVNFQTGMNESGSDMTRFQSGDFQVGDVKIAYGILDELFVSFDVYQQTFEINPYTGTFMVGAFANPELGINWQIFRPAKSFALDVIGKYGIAWTRDAVTGDRIGMNNVQAGARIYGDEGKFQWAVQGLAQLAMTPEGMSDWWNLLARAEFEYEIVEKVGLKAEYNFNTYNMSKSNSIPVIYDQILSLGAVIDVQPGVAAIQPYVAYHFPTTGSGGMPSMSNNFWQIGAKFGIQF
ncbi:MAG: hypothetical protein FWE50_01740 [Alphaproteobacteria bacterium]|nr:hypothetical protein [Alphaproteobacteria bacterium]